LQPTLLHVFGASLQSANPRRETLGESDARRRGEVWTFGLEFGHGALLALSALSS
jgi:hypothetical protein